MTKNMNHSNRNVELFFALSGYLYGLSAFKKGG